MTKLNNKGWGFSMFIAFIVVFCIAIILIIIGAIKLGISSEKDISKLPVTEVTPSPTSNGTVNNTNDDYTAIIKNYEEQIVNGGKGYISDNQLTIPENDSLTVTLVTLVNNNYISKLEISGQTCTGYLVINNREKDFSYNTILNCGNGYTSDTYDRNLDEMFNN